MRVILKGIAVLSGALVLAGFLGGVHPAGDSFAVFRLPLAVIFGLSVIWTTWSASIRWPLAGLASAAILTTMGLTRAAPDMGSGAWTLYQQNLLFSRKTDAAFLKNVAEIQPEFVTLQEVSGRNRAILAALEHSHPTQVYCPFATVGGVAVASRFPAIPGTETCAEKDGLAAVQLETDNGPVWLVSVHLHWPWPYGQSAHTDRLIPYLEALDGPVLLAGDFNAVPWSHTVRRIEKATRTKRVPSNAATFELPYLRMPVTIDHLLTSEEFDRQVQAVPKFGSDHNGAVALIGGGGT